AQRAAKENRCAADTFEGAHRAVNSAGRDALRALEEFTREIVRCCFLGLHFFDPLSHWVRAYGVARPGLLTSPRPKGGETTNHIPKLVAYRATYVIMYCAPARLKTCHVSSSASSNLIKPCSASNEMLAYSPLT